MKWRQFVTRLKISKVFKGLIVLGLLKLALLWTLAWHLAPLDTINRGVSGESAAQVAGTVVKTIISPDEALAQSQALDQSVAPSTGESSPDMKASSSSQADPCSNEAQIQREEELNRREQSLQSLEKQLDEKLQRLQELEVKLDRMLTEAKEIKDKKLRHLIDVYSNMKAKQAAVVIETLDEKIAVKILAGMRGRQAGEILTYVAAEKAARLTEALTNLQMAN